MFRCLPAQYQEKINCWETPAREEADQQIAQKILGFYVADSEGANFWLGVLNDLKQRDVQDVLIACIDGLTGFPEAIKGIFPKTEIQLCIVQQIPNSLKYVASKNQKEFMNDLKAVYQALNKDVAEHHLLKLEEKWGKKYPMVSGIRIRSI